MAKLTTDVSSRLRELRRAKGLTLEQVAEKANTTFGQIHKLERSMRPLTLEWIERLAGALGVAPAELMGSSASAPTNAPQLRRIPVLGRIAAGGWEEAVQDASEFVWGAASEEAFALKPNGTSMNLLVPDGGYVVINPRDRDLRDGLVYAVQNGDNDATLKRYRAEPARLEPCSDDPTHQTLMLGQVPFTVVGRAIEAIRPL